MERTESPFMSQMEQFTVRVT
ncbi:hypothetical protein BQ8794_320108 [Mesorhizobium prunaredense]|uniref:Uncharacterized protein n=1 Tax=Mesorhizobium prunaredense TaxID=1631249 RepID=A0A1R3VBH5_9HYPH|nr:hypothetical protein BQ8794_320108 [Mesorhizobium prunaredense]